MDCGGTIAGATGTRRCCLFPLLAFAVATAPVRAQTPPLKSRQTLDGPLTTRSVAGPAWARNQPLYEVNLDVYRARIGAARSCFIPTRAPENIERTVDRHNLPTNVRAKYVALPTGALSDTVTRRKSALISTINDRPVTRPVCRAPCIRAARRIENEHGCSR